MGQCKLKSIETRVESAWTTPGTKRSKLKCDKLLPVFAFNFNLRRYSEERSAGTEDETDEVEMD